MLIQTIFIFNIILFLCLTFGKTYVYTIKFNLNFVNPLLIIYITNIPILVMQIFVGPIYQIELGIFDPYFNFALLMGSLSNISELCLILFCFKYFKKSNKIEILISYLFKSSILIPKKIFKLAIFSYVLFLFTFLILTSEFGVLNWLGNPREGYQFYRTGVGFFYALCYLFLTTSCVFASYACRSKLHLFIVFLFYLSTSYFLGSKGYMISFFIYFLIMIVTFYRKFTFNFSILGSLIIVPVILTNFGSIDFVDIANYFDFYPNATLFYTEYFLGNFGLYYGKIFFTDFFSWVPRIIYPDKPFVYGILYINEYFFPGAAEETMTPAFAGPIAAFADFGIIGVFFFGFFSLQTFFNFFMYKVLFANYNIILLKTNSLKLISFMYIFGPQFLAFFSFPLGIVGFCIWLVILNFFYKIKIF